MAPDFSVRASTFTMQTLRPSMAEEKSTSRAPGSSTPAPGRTMIKVPRKPIAVAVQRRPRTTSRKNNTAAMVANSGAVKLNAMTSPSGISERA